jgi:VanZ family protein
MTPSTKKRLLTLALVLWIGYTILFSVIKMPKDNRIDRWHLDVVFHFTSYLVMAVLGAALIRWWALVPAVVIAAGTELVQGRLPYRTASWSDFGINLGGMVLGILVWRLVTTIRKRRLVRITSNEILKTERD